MPQPIYCRYFDKKKREKNMCLTATCQHRVITDFLVRKLSSSLEPMEPDDTLVGFDLCTETGDCKGLLEDPCLNAAEDGYLIAGEQLILVRVVGE